VPGVRAQLTTFAYRGATRVAEIIPTALVPGLGSLAGRIGGWPQRDARRMSTRHQARVTGTADADVDAVFECYGRYWIEIFRLPAEVRRGEILPNFTIDGYEHITAGLAAGRGVLLALPHLGGWEWAAAWMAAQGHHMLAVVEPLEPPALFEWFVRQREAIGLEIVPIGPDVSRRVLRALRDNRIVCLLSDRDLTGDGVEVEFFGERTTLPAGPATLALRTGAAILPVAVYFDGPRGHHGVVLPPIPSDRQGSLRDDIARITQCLAHEFEGLIRAAPAQWHLLQPNWPSDRS
jgi:phosphatidylinositol dimannoside acyltransferase